jgi:hypothetical protein
MSTEGEAMNALTKEQAISWCRQRSVAITGDNYLYFPESRRCIAIELPAKPYELVSLANSLLPYDTEVPFQGALLWIRQWGVWNELVERSGLRVMEVIRRMHGSTIPLEEAPGYLFESQELIDLQVCLIQPLLIGWDAFMIPESADYIVATSHDEVTCVMSRTPQTHGRLLAELQPWSPREDADWYFRGTEIPAT